MALNWRQRGEGAISFLNPFFICTFRESILKDSKYPLDVQCSKEGWTQLECKSLEGSMETCGTINIIETTLIEIEQKTDVAPYPLPPPLFRKVSWTYQITHKDLCVSSAESSYTETSSWLVYRRQLLAWYVYKRRTDDMERGWLPHRRHPATYRGHDVVIWRGQQIVRPPLNAIQLVLLLLLLPTYPISLQLPAEQKKEQIKSFNDCDLIQFCYFKGQSGDTGTQLRRSGVDGTHNDWY